MKDDPHELGRAREELAAARLLESGGFPAQAISRAYYAAFYAAEAALGRLGEEAAKAIGDAETVVAAVADWLSRSTDR